MTIKHPHVAEGVVDMMEFENKMQFIVDIDATKPEVADAIEAQFDVTVLKVTSMVTPQGEKKVTVQLSDDDDAMDIASRVGVF